MKNNDELSLVYRVNPNDLNHHNNMFGGSIMSKMDEAASIYIEKYIKYDAVTVGANNIKFLSAIKNGDILEIYSNIVKLGKKSITVKIKVFSKNKLSNKEVANGIFTFVFIKKNKKTKSIRKINTKKLHTKILNMLNPNYAIETNN